MLWLKKLGAPHADQRPFIDVSELSAKLMTAGVPWRGGLAGSFSQSSQDW